MSAPKMRRQNHSCEQCRRSRKACDGYALNVSPSEEDYQLRPCSYCARTRKPCSFNIYWGEAQLPTPAFAPQTEELQSVSRMKRQRTESMTGTAAAASTHNVSTYGVDNDEILQDMLQSLETPSSGDNTLWHDSALSLGSTFATSPSCVSDQKYADVFSEYSYDQIGLPRTASSAQSASRHVLSPTQALSFDSLSNLSTADGSQSLGPYQDPLIWLNPNLYSGIAYDQASAPQQPILEEELWPQDAASQEIAKTRAKTRTISPFNADHGVMTSMNNTLITDSLLGIYHDVLENNLACWLAEDTCPYKGKTGQELATLMPKPVMPTNSLRQACGPNWSNRIYSRVIQLDRVAQKTGQLSLTRGENRAASKALSLAIMAFATQWSQGNCHGADYLSTGLNVSAQIGISRGEQHDFEQNVQQSTWEQARQALQECSDLESYRVVYAELIFGLVQKPLPPRRKIGQSSHEHFVGFAQRKREVMKMLAIQNQPVFVERATRKVHSMKFRLDAAETGFSMFGEPPARLMAEDRSTIGLLYWLAVMLDTVSSSISEKPVALADEDCQHEALEKEANNASPPVNRRWEARLFVQDDLDKPTLSLRWPCNYHDAAEGVARSAPVKVLLFRYISYLQNTLRKRESAKAVEDVISGALLLYRYWNTTYGSFFRGLIRDYNTIPARIKSWFVCILVPWNLGALMLADLIEFVDNHNMGFEQASRSRIAESLPSVMRALSANELSDIAHVTTPAHYNSGSRQLPDLHFAVNQGSLLTEPWTILLVNAFAKASLYHLEILDGLESEVVSPLGSDGEAVQNAVQRIDSCARCLWFLGRKTSVAGDISAVLLESIGHYKTPY
jgi:hypothetical protein